MTPRKSRTASTRIDNIVKNWLAPVLVLLLVALTSYTLGREGRSTEETTTLAAEQKSVTAPVANNAPSNTDIITDIQQSLAQPSPTTAQASGSNQQKTTSSKSAATASKPVVSNGIVNINTGTLAELDTLPGIGPKYAQGIIDYRTQNGPFIRVDDLVKVKGIGPKTLEKLRPLVTI